MSGDGGSAGHLSWVRRDVVEDGQISVSSKCGNFLRWMEGPRTALAIQLYVSVVRFWGHQERVQSLDAIPEVLDISGLHKT